MSRASTQTAASASVPRHREAGCWEKGLILGLGQGVHKMSQEHLEVAESKEVPINPEGGRLQRPGSCRKPPAGRSGAGPAGKTELRRVMARG